MNAIEGIIIKANTGLYHVHTNEGVVVCRLRGNLKKQFEFTTSHSRARKVIDARKKSTTDPVAVGDRVHIDIDGSRSGPLGDEGVIDKVLPRRSEVARTRRVIGSALGEGRHVLVANVEQLVVVFAAAEPRPDLWKLDSFLAIAESSGLDAVVVANKVDLVDADTLEEEFGLYRRIGYRLLPTSAATGTGLEELRELLVGKVSSFCGPSGVGKSSLLNALNPDLARHVSEIGGVTYKGRHGTTSVELVPLDPGASYACTGWVADTPGLRQVELWKVPHEEIANCFVEFRPYLGQCKFHDCAHRREPNCAITTAVGRGEIHERRYRSFVSLSGE